MYMYVPWKALFSAKRWRLDVLTFLIKGFGQSIQIGLAQSVEHSYRFFNVSNTWYRSLVHIFFSLFSGNQPQGWTTDSSKDISIGEIFLMTHGNNAKQQTNLELQYTWKSQNDSQNPQSSQNTQNPLQSQPKYQQNSAFSFLSKLASAELNKKLPNSSSKIVKTLSFEATNGIRYIKYFSFSYISN